MSSNLVTIKSAEHFKEQLSEDLQRVSVINFWAPLAEPCIQMNAVVEALAKKHESILFLQAISSLSRLDIRLKPPLPCR
jgi:thiol-disulfide isomerase/thioredoxin